ncbi:MAG TPA: AAA family ATPase [Blastocatellia bacterium]|jgi:hypothetical protein|nr:AAA family ATPase [Blastocatellia bacterium]
MEIADRECARLGAEAVFEDPPDSGGKANTKTTTNGAVTTLSVRRLADVEPETVDWLWSPYLPLAKVTMLEGDPGVGKSWLTCAIATAIAQGFGLPGMAPREPAAVLLMSAEDGLGDTIRPRLDSMLADVARIFAVETLFSLDSKGLLAVEAAIAHHTPALVIIDPLVAYISGEVDIHRANAVREVMARLGLIATRQRCAILCVRHLNKSGQTKAVYRGLGSIDFNAAVRSGLLAGVDPDDPTSGAIIHFKSNLAPKGEAIGYTLRPGQGFCWAKQTTLTAQKILSGLAEDEEQREARKDAEEFLRGLLAAGEVEASEIMKARQVAQVSDYALRKAKTTLGIRVRTEKPDGKFGGTVVRYWSMPEDAELPPEDVEKGDDQRLQATNNSTITYSDDSVEGVEGVERAKNQRLQGENQHFQGREVITI